MARRKTRGGGRSKARAARKVDPCKLCTRKLATAARAATRAQERRARQKLTLARKEASAMGPFVSPARRRARHAFLAEESLRAKYGGDPRGRRRKHHPLAHDPRRPRHVTHGHRPAHHGRHHRLGLMDMRDPRRPRRGHHDAYDPRHLGRPHRSHYAMDGLYGSRYSSRSRHGRRDLGRDPGLYNLTRHERRSLNPHQRHSRAAELGWNHRNAVGKKGFFHNVARHSLTGGRDASYDSYDRDPARRRRRRATSHRDLALDPRRHRRRPYGHHGGRYGRDVALDFAMDPARRRRRARHHRDFALDFAMDPARRRRRTTHHRDFALDPARRHRRRPYGRFGGHYGRDLAGF